MIKNKTQTAFDTLMYSLGQTDEVKGTGVWSAFKLKRDPEEKEEDDDKEGKETQYNKYYYYYYKEVCGQIRYTSS